jgi:uncharacterized SAM-binding protein YcdF (DUF218 family)
VIQAMIDQLKPFLRPSSTTFFVIVLAIGVALAFARRTQRLARWYFAAALAAFWIASTPACVERLLQREAAKYPPLATPADARGASTVVVLGSGNATVQAHGLTLNQVPWIAALRLLEAARLYVLLGHPKIIVSGGVTGREEGARPEAEGMRDAIVQLGVAPADVIVEAESKNTREEALVIGRMLADRRRQPIVLVTSPTHMARSLAVFRAAGLDPIPSVAPYKSDHSFERLRWMPQDGGLLMTDTFLYDTLATWYYRLAGAGAR